MAHREKRPAAGGEQAVVGQRVAGRFGALGWLRSLLSGDRWLGLVALLSLLGPLPRLLAAVGVTGEQSWPPVHWLQRGTDIFIWAIFALSYDLLLGFTGIVSFGHSLYLAIGAYAVAIGVMKLGAPLWLTILVAVVVGAIVSALVGSLSLRLKGHGFAMITLAFAEVGHVLALKASTWTGGEDGLSVMVPRWMASRVNGYYVALLGLILIFLVMRRITRSPFGRVLAAIRENEDRALALGFNVTAYKVGALTLAGVIAALAGVAQATVGSRFAIASMSTAGPTIDVLLMTILGGVGTLTGPVIGAAIVRLLAYVLPSFATLSPLFQRWPLFLGLIYILTVLFLPAGVVGASGARLKATLGRLLPASLKREAA
jgi:branched-chain amino acid transport system permease protein